MSPISSHPILTCAETKAWESALLTDAAAEWAAMQRAGAALAAAVAGDCREIGGLPATARLLVLVGKGHNGGDALLAAQFILEKYPQATADVLLCFGETALRPLAYPVRATISASTASSASSSIRRWMRPSRNCSRR